MRVKIFSLLWLVVSCGQAAPEGILPDDGLLEQKTSVEEPGSDSSNPPLAIAVASPSELPACNDLSKGQVVYTISDNRFQYCADGKWNSINQDAQNTQQAGKSVSSLELKTSWRGFLSEDVCGTDYCYFKDIVITDFGSGIFHYNFVLYSSENAYTDSDTKTYTGFAKVNSSGFLIADLNIQLSMDKSDFENLWFAWKPGEAKGFIIRDADRSYSPNDVDSIIAEVEMLEDKNMTIEIE